MVVLMLKEGIVFPENQMSRESYMSLSPQNRLRYIESIVKDTIHMNKGITATQICKSLTLSYQAVKRHLDALEARGECYKVKYGESYVYFPNGINMHPEMQRKVEKDGVLYEFSFLKNGFGEFFHVQEKVREPDGRYRSKGAIMIPIGLLETFYSTSAKTIKEYFKKVKGDSNADAEPT
jgi:predicted transcriptional regulator